MKNKEEHNSKDKIQWETVEALESIANQCIYKGKEVAKARALLKALYKEDIEYNDEATCDDKNAEGESAA